MAGANLICGFMTVSFQANAASCRRSQRPHRDRCGTGESAALSLPHRDAPPTARPVILLSPMKDRRCDDRTVTLIEDIKLEPIANMDNNNATPPVGNLSRWILSRMASRVAPASVYDNPCGYDK